MTSTPQKASIAIDGHVLTGRYQGTRTTLSRLLQAVGPRLGARRIVIYSDAPATARSLIDSDAFEYRDLGRAGPISRLLRVLPRLFRRDGIDLGVFQYMAPLAGRNLVFIHDLLPISHPHLFPLKVRLRTHIFFSLAIWRAAMVVAVSEYTRDAIASHYRLKPDRLRTVINGPSFADEVYAVPAVATADRYILTVGRIEPRKNTELLVEAFKRAKLLGVRLVIVGTWDPEFKRGTIEGPGVEVHSTVDDTALIELYRGASLFVYPSEAEGFGVPLLDATLFGLPVLSSDRTALPEVGRDLVEYFDPTAPDAADVLASRIAGHFADHPIRRPNTKERAAQAARFSWNKAAEAFLTAVDVALGQA